jgi:tRNA-dihydrouridine synthase B
MAIDPPRPRALTELPPADVPRPGPLFIGSLEVSPPLLQAPMAGLTTVGMRTLAEEQGCGLTISEWLPATAVAAGVESALRKLEPSREERAFGVQLFGREPRAIERAAAICCGIGAAVVDINMGCPGKRVRSGATGAALMREPELAAELVCAALAGVSGRAEVTVKMRAGWDDDQRNAPELAAKLEGVGAKLITVHGRTRQQRYQGRVDLTIIREVKQAVSVPVVANGDVVDLPSMLRAFRETGADGVMVGRAALGNPWVFAQLAAFWSGELPTAPTVRERVETYWRHLELQREATDIERAAVVEMRKFARWYLWALPGGEALKRAIFREERVSAVRELLDAYLASVDGDATRIDPS